MYSQTIVLLVKSDAPIDKFFALHSELEINRFYGDVVLKYEDGKIRRAIVSENVKF